MYTASDALLWVSLSRGSLHCGAVGNSCAKLTDFTVAFTTNTCTRSPVCQGGAPQNCELYPNHALDVILHNNSCIQGTLRYNYIEQRRQIRQAARMKSLRNK